MNIILQKELNDCHNAAIGTACEVSYEKAAKATGHVNLPGMLESPVFSNPWNMYRALTKLGFWKRNLTWADLKAGRAKPGKTIVLVKQSLMQQHWVVWDGLQHFSNNKTFHRVYWGDSEEPRLISEAEFENMFLRKILGDKRLFICAFEVYRASIWKLMWERLKSIFK